MIYGYLRVSTDLQDVESQKQSILLYEQKNNVKIEKYITDDGISGAVDYEERNLGKLLKACKKDDIIVASEISRFGRDLFMVMRFLETCMKKELKVYTIKDGYELGDNIQSKVLAFAFGLAAEIERDLKTKRTNEGQKLFLAKGGKMGSISRQPRLKLTQFDKEIRKLCAQGKSMAYIGRCFGVTTETVNRYIEYTNIPYTKKEICNNSKNHKATEKNLIECRNTIIYAINQGMTFQEIYKHVKKCHNIKISEKSIRYYIRKDKALNDLWINRRNLMRCECNLIATPKQSKRLQYQEEIERLKELV